VHLSSLTLRGFKSFASSTTLRFEPGITCVVGPNGSGKSNVVDALAWVMGEQGAKSLRGGKMEDVIFAGTAAKAPLGRAEVLLTIDNSDGALPIEYTEVTISRIMFRTGGSEYAINGRPCRLLDIQELLSDSGIGREMHVVVGQGQLDAILHANPVERRGFIEEAAGVLKHRKRKEKALRKLEAMGANLTRLEDLTTELRRQLKPLGKQAEVARRASVIQADLRDARLRLLADDLLQGRLLLQREQADETALRERRTAVEVDLAQANQREHELDTAVREEAPRVAATQETWYRLVSLRERFRGLESLARERSRNLHDDVAAARSGPDPAELAAEAASVRSEADELSERLTTDGASLLEREQARLAAENALAVEEARLAGLLRAAADRREGYARLVGQRDALRSRVESAEAELGRLQATRVEATERAERAQREFTSLESKVAGLDAGELDLDTAHERASAALGEAELRLERLLADEQTAERDRVALVARKEALELGLRRKDGAAALLAAGEALSGLLGSVAGMLVVEPGWESAIAAALGTAADAVAAADLASAAAAVRHLRAEDDGRAALLVSGATAYAARATWPVLPTGVAYALDVVKAPAALEAALTNLLARVALADDLEAALDLALAHPELSVASRDGDVVAAGVVIGGSAAAPSLLEVQAAVDEATDALQTATARSERLRFELVDARAQHGACLAEVEGALARLHESDAEMAAVAEGLAHLGATARAAAAEAARIARAIEAAEGERAGAAPALDELDARVAAAETAPAPVEPDRTERNRLDEVCAATRQAEVEVRLAVRTAEERLRSLRRRADELERSAAEELAQRDRAAARRAQRAAAARVAGAVAGAATTVLARLERSITDAGSERTAAETARTAREVELTAVRARTRELASALERLVDSVHRDEVARAEQRLRVEALETKAVEELGIDPDTLLAEYGPEVPVPPSRLVPEPAADGSGTEAGATVADDDGTPVPYVRADQEKRMRAAERSLAVLGRVNPLALEEFAALEERQAFLTEQLEDLKNTRRDLLGIIREVDERVQQVFMAAYEDTAREFTDVFSRLFPGGEGRLVLTDPDDPVNTGVDVEARPAGKRVKRLSLLSGGERSLTAVALLVAIFKARPSPFYVLDEVEAALDDTNLGRLLVILEELQATSQLIVVTHQKRTMEIADALYGVTMRSDGETTVISQRLRDSVPA
jgi:chromosome segregation protein